MFLKFIELLRTRSTISLHCFEAFSPLGGAPGSPFTDEKDYLDALKAHHIVMSCAMKAKQNVEPGAIDALEHAVDDCCKMYLPAA